MSPWLRHNEADPCALEPFTVPFGRNRADLEPQAVHPDPDGTAGTTKILSPSRKNPRGVGTGARTEPPIIASMRPVTLTCPQKHEHPQMTDVIITSIIRYYLLFLSLYAIYVACTFKTQHSYRSIGLL